MASKPPQIRSISEFDEPINILIYGDSGVGKTVLAGTAPGNLMLGVERGLISAKRAGSKADFWPIHTWEDLQEAYRYLRQNPRHGYKWITVDSATEMQQMALRWILTEGYKKYSKHARDPDLPEIQDHQKWQNMFKRMVGSFNALPANVLWTATAMRREDEEGDDLVLPDIQGKGYQIAQWTCASMQVVGYLSVRKGKDGGKYRRLMCEADPPYVGKDRYDVLIPYVSRPDMADITERIEALPPEVRKAAASPATKRARPRMRPNTTRKVATNAAT